MSSYCRAANDLGSYLANIFIFKLFEIHAKKNILLESMFLSTMYGRLGEFLKSKNAIFAYMDTPLDVCLERILARRKQVGNSKPFDADKTVVPRYRQIQNNRLTAINLNCRVVDIPYKSALATLLKLARKEG